VLFLRIIFSRNKQRVKERADLSLFAHLGCHFRGSEAWVRFESKAAGSFTICKP